MPPLRGFPSEYRHPVWYGKTRMVGLPDGEKIEDIYNGLDTIPACDRQTDRHLATAYTRYAYASRSNHYQQTRFPGLKNMFAYSAAQHN